MEYENLWSPVALYNNFEVGFIHSNSPDALWAFTDRRYISTITPVKHVRIIYVTIKGTAATYAQFFMITAQLFKGLPVVSR